MWDRRERQKNVYLGTTKAKAGKHNDRGKRGTSETSEKERQRQKNVGGWKDSGWCPRKTERTLNLGLHIYKYLMKFV